MTTLKENILEAENSALRELVAQAGLDRALADRLALALGESRVQHERLDVRAQLGDDERDPIGHQAGNEMDL